MTTRRFQQVDVFASAPLAGNPLAVVVDAEGLSTDEMLRFTRWMNLSETTFLLPPTDPTADYRVRIFTLAGELPFAGHPTLGSCHVWLSTHDGPRGGDPVVQECGAGLVPIRPSGDGLAFAAPPLVRSGPVDPDLRAELATILGIEATDIVDLEWVDNGPGWVGVLLEDADTVLRLDPDFSRYRGSGSLMIGLVGPSHDDGYDFEVRGLFSDEFGRMREDPVTGSLNASLGQWLFESGRASGSYVARQGTRLGRAGRVRVDQDAAGEVWIGGAVTTIVEGTVEL